jgi:hypothetical protein
MDGKSFTSGLITDGWRAGLQHSRGSNATAFDNVLVKSGADVNRAFDSTGQLFRFQRRFGGQKYSLRLTAKPHYTLPVSELSHAP